MMVKRSVRRTPWLRVSLGIVGLAILISHLLRSVDDSFEFAPPEGSNAAKLPYEEVPGIASKPLNRSLPNPLSGQREMAMHLPRVPSRSENFDSDPEALFLSLTSLYPEERLKALEMVLQSEERLYARDEIYRRIAELIGDDDVRVVKLAHRARSRLMELRRLHELPNESPTDEAQADSTQEDMANSPPEWSGEAETERDLFDRLRERAIYDADPAVRLQGIEQAVTQADEMSTELLSEALGDSEADNRLTAVSELEQMLNTGLGNTQELLSILENAQFDSDARVSELAELIIKKHSGEIWPPGSHSEP